VEATEIRVLTAAAVTALTASGGDQRSVTMDRYPSSDVPRGTMPQPLQPARLGRCRVLSADDWPGARGAELRQRAAGLVFEGLPQPVDDVGML
jgi:hypothetical protein